MDTYTFFPNYHIDLVLLLLDLLIILLGMGSRRCITEVWNCRLLASWGRMGSIAVAGNLGSIIAALTVVLCLICRTTSLSFIGMFEFIQYYRIFIY